MVVKRATEHKIFRAAMSGLLGMVVVLLSASTVVSAAGEKTSVTNRQAFERPWEHRDGTVSYRDLEFQDWATYAAWRLSSDPSFDRRCATPTVGAGPSRRGDFESDCGLGNNHPLERFDPSTGDFVIPVVVHVNRDSTGRLGDISESRILEQIRILNAVFAGPLGEYRSSETGIRFVLSRRTPDDQPSDGYTFHDNDE